MARYDHPAWDAAQEGSGDEVVPPELRAGLWQGENPFITPMMQSHADRMEREFGREQGLRILTHQEPVMTPHMERLADRMERILTQRDDGGDLSGSSAYSTDSRTSDTVVDSNDRD